MDGQAIRVLLVEDNPGDAYLIRGMLSESGGADFSLEWVTRLSEGLTCLEKTGFDILLLDLGLPDSLGLETLARAQAQAPQVPIVVLTGLADEALALAAVQQGAQDYLFKGEITPPLLRRAIRYAYERKKAELAVEAERRKLFGVLNNLPALVHLKGDDFQIRFANRRFKEAFGDPAGRSCYEILRGRNEPCEDCPSIEVLRSGVPRQFEWTDPRQGRIYEMHQYPFCAEFPLVLTLGLDITARKQAETELHEELAVKTALADITNALISRTASPELIAEIALVHAKSLTGSEHGYATLIDPVTGDNIAYDLGKMTDFCQVPGEQKRIALARGPDGPYPGLWGHSLDTQEGFYTNAPASHPAFWGLSQGHISFKNFLAVPAVVAGKVVGQIALANSNRDYTDRDLQAIQRLAKFYALIIQRQQAEQSIQESEEQLAAINANTPLIILVVDRDRRVCRMNRMAEEFAGVPAATLLGRRWGEALHCLHSLDDPQGCGFGPSCQCCPVRLTVLDTFETGGSHHQVEATLPMKVQGKTQEITFLLYTTLLTVLAEPQVLVAIQDITARKQAEETLRYLASQLMTAQERERQRISRELHDGLGQSLLVLKLQAREIARLVDQDNPSAARQECEELRTRVEQLVNDVRRMSHNLSPALLQDLGLTVALKRLIEDFTRHNQMEAEVVLPDGLDPLFPREAQVNLYRIFQESLTNIGKYSQATRLSIAVDHRNGQIAFRVADNGRGFNLEEVLGRNPARRGLGLAAMEERVRMMGGVLEIKSREGEGTQISFAVPLPASAA